MLIRVDEIAERCSVGRWAVVTWITRGYVPCPVVIGNHVRWPEETLQTWLNAGCPTGPPPEEDLMRQIRHLDVEELRENMATDRRAFDTKLEIMRVGTDDVPDAES